MQHTNSAPVQFSPDIARSRVLSSADAAALAGFSLAHFRRLYRAGKVPKPIKISDRKLGWQAGPFTDWLAARAVESDS